MPPAKTTAELLVNLRERLAQLDDERAHVMRAIAALEPLAEVQSLLSGNQGDSNSDMTSGMYSGLRQKHSSLKAKTKGVARFLVYCHEAGFNSIREACEKAGFSQPYVSQCLAASNPKPASRRLRETFERLVKFPPDLWPNQGE